MKLKELDVLLNYGFIKDEVKHVYRKENYYIAWAPGSEIPLLVDDSMKVLSSDRYLMTTGNLPGYKYRNVPKELFFKFISGDLRNLRAVLWNYELEKTLENLNGCT
jgi:hypothetical protein